MTTPDELQRVVEGLDTALRSKASHVELRDFTSDLHLLLSERAELLAAVERMRGEMAGMETRLRRWEPRVSLDMSVACAITRAALTTGEGK